MEAKLYEYKGEFKPLKAWADQYRHSYQTLHARLRNGWTMQRTLEQPSIGQGTKMGPGMSKNDAELELNALPFDSLPPQFQKIVKEWNFKGNKYGKFLRSMARKAFDIWFEVEYLERIKSNDTSIPRTG